MSTQTTSHPSPRPFGRVLINLLLLLTTAVLTFAFGIIAYIAFQMQSQGRILPSIDVLGQDLSGETALTAAHKLNRYWHTKTIRVETNGFHRAATPAELGLILDAEASAQAAANWSHSHDFYALFDFLQAGGHVEPVWELDVAQTQQFLQALATELDHPPLNAGVRFDAENNRLLPTPPSKGTHLDIPLTIAWLTENAGTVVYESRLPLHLTAVNPTITNTTSLISEINARLTTPLHLNLYDPISHTTTTWEIPPHTWAQWLDVQPTAALQLDWSVQASRIRPFVNQQMATLPNHTYIDTDTAVQTLQTLALNHIKNQPSAETPLRLYHMTTSHIVQAGETFASIARQYRLPYPWLQQANPAVGDGLRIGQELTIPSPDTFLPLPIIPHKRIFISISEQTLRAYEGDTLHWEWLISTGIANSPTAVGVYQVQTHEPNAYAANWDLWMPNFMGIYQPVPQSDFMNGFHGFPTRGGNNLLWTNSLGTPVTYGCILVGNEQMQQLYNWAEAGTIVEIQP